MLQAIRQSLQLRAGALTRELAGCLRHPASKVLELCLEEASRDVGSGGFAASTPKLQTIGDSVPKPLPTFSVAAWGPSASH